ncbi:hypothetical protein E3N88_30317 [Mikania micrantha]|uniref:Uncharacterized protein n=1 Tax=Mikania micrantha TaxID=192012 RepID=A0A5N6MLQ5_9ASTR|nr:hypothetical protein E3N88_30317 [Mikania micrantha]
MIPATGFSYRRLRNESDDDHDYEEKIKQAIDLMKERTRRSSRLHRVHMRKRLKMKIPSLRKFVRRRARLVVISMTKVLKRLNDSRSHFGDLFAGNYLFMQVNPTPLKSSSPYAIRASVKRKEDELRQSTRI